MAKSKIVTADQKIAKKVVSTHNKIEQTVVGGYKSMEAGVVKRYNKMEDWFVDRYLTRDGETAADAKKRLSAERTARTRHNGKG